MNHYPRHIGDWLRDTAHLTETEECIYSRLIDQYYSREKPLPVDPSQCCRLVRANSRESRKAVVTVLSEFFTQSSDGWRQKRCDQEIEKFQTRSIQAADSARERWKKANANAQRTHSDGNANQNQEPEPIKSNALSSSAEKPPKLDVVSLKLNTVNSERREAAKEIIGFLNSKTAKNYRLVDPNLGPIMARMKEGATVRELRAVIARKCREWGSDEKMARFLRPATLFNATNFAQYVGEVPPESEVSDAVS